MVSNTVAGMDINALSWVQAEIEQSLTRGLEQLAIFRQSPTNQSELARARAHFRQAVGAIQMVGLEALAVYAGEIEIQLGSLATRPVAEIEATASVIETACQKLQMYLAELSRGAPLTPLILFSEYEAMQQLRGIRVSLPADLFFPDISVRLPDDGPQVAVTVEQFPDLLIHKRRTFQHGLLDWLRGHVGSGAERMQRAVVGIHEATPQHSVRTFWATVLALYDLIRAGALQNSFPLQHLLARIDLQIRRLAEGGGSIAERLRRETLYFIAANEKPVSGRETQIRQLFHLDGMVPPQSVNGQELLKSYATVRDIKTHVNGVKTSWARLIAGQTDQYKKLREELLYLFKHAVDSPYPDMQMLFGLLFKGSEALTPQSIPEAVGMEFATALLFAEDVFAQYGAPISDLTQQIAAIRARLEATMRGQTPPKFELPRLNEISRQAEDKVLLPQLAGGIQANLRHMEQELDAFFRDNNKRGALGALAKDGSEISGALRVLGWQEADKLLQMCLEQIDSYTKPETQLKNDDFELLAESLSAMGFYIEALQQQRPQNNALLKPLIKRYRQRNGLPPEDDDEPPDGGGGGKPFPALNKEESSPGKPSTASIKGAPAVAAQQSVSRTHPAPATAPAAMGAVKKVGQPLNKQQSQPTTVPAVVQKAIPGTTVPKGTEEKRPLATTDERARPLHFLEVSGGVGSSGVDPQADANNRNQHKTLDAESLLVSDQAPAIDPLQLVGSPTISEKEEVLPANVAAKNDLITAVEIQMPVDLSLPPIELMSPEAASEGEPLSGDLSDQALAALDSLTASELDAFDANLGDAIDPDGFAALQAGINDVNLIEENDEVVAAIQAADSLAMSGQSLSEEDLDALDAINIDTGEPLAVTTNKEPARSQAGAASGLIEDEDVPLEEQVKASLKELARLGERLEATPDSPDLFVLITKKIQLLGDDAKLINDTTLLDKIATIKKTLASDQHADLPALLANLVAAPKVVAPSAEAERLLRIDAKALDAELLDIFLEEAGDMLDAIEENRADLAQNPNDQQIIRNIRRAFHTMKGSGRMVGLTELGDLAFAVESALNQVLEVNSPATPRIQQLMELAEQEFRGWIQSLISTKEVAPDPRELLEAIQAVRAELQPKVSLADLLANKVGADALSPDPHLPSLEEMAFPILLAPAIDPGSPATPATPEREVQHTEQPASVTSKAKETPAVPGSFTFEVPPREAHSPRRDVVDEAKGQTLLTSRPQAGSALDDDEEDIANDDRFTFTLPRTHPKKRRGLTPEMSSSSARMGAKPVPETPSPVEQVPPPGMPTRVAAQRASRASGGAARTASKAAKSFSSSSSSPFAVPTADVPEEDVPTVVPTIPDELLPENQVPAPVKRPTESPFATPDVTVSPFAEPAVLPRVAPDQASTESPALTPFTSSAAAMAAAKTNTPRVPRSPFAEPTLTVATPPELPPVAIPEIPELPPVTLPELSELPQEVAPIAVPEAAIVDLQVVARPQRQSPFAEPIQFNFEAADEAPATLPPFTQPPVQVYDGPQSEWPTITPTGIPGEWPTQTPTLAQPTLSPTLAPTEWPTLNDPATVLPPLMVPITDEPEISVSFAPQAFVPTDDPEVVSVSFASSQLRPQQEPAWLPVHGFDPDEVMITVVGAQPPASITGASPASATSQSRDSLVPQASAGIPETSLFAQPPQVPQAPQQPANFASPFADPEDDSRFPDFPDLTITQDTAGFIDTLDLDTLPPEDISMDVFAGDDADVPVLTAAHVFADDGDGENIHFEVPLSTFDAGALAAETPEPHPEAGAISMQIIANKPKAEAKNFISINIVDDRPAEPPLPADCIRIGEIVLSQSLYDLFIAEAAQHWQTLANELPHLDGNALPSEAMIRAVHTLASIHGTTGFTLVFNVGRALENLLVSARERADAGGQPMSRLAEVAARAVGALRVLMDSILARRVFNSAESDEANAVLTDIAGLASEQTLPADLAEAKPEVVEEAPATHRQSIGMEDIKNFVLRGNFAPQPLVPVAPQNKRRPEPLTVEESAASSISQELRDLIARKQQEKEKQQEKAAQVTPVIGEETPDQHGDGLDEQLLPIFLEESAELLQSATDTLAVWVKNPKDQETTLALKRNLHTLKGSARMVGALRLGELTHQVESYLLESEQSGAAEVEKVSVGIERIDYVIRQLRSGQREVSFPWEASSEPVKEAEPPTKAEQQVKAQVEKETKKKDAKQEVAKAPAQPPAEKPAEASPQAVAVPGETPSPVAVPAKAEPAATVADPEPAAALPTRRRWQRAIVEIDTSPVSEDEALKLARERAIADQKQRAVVKKSAPQVDEGALLRVAASKIDRLVNEAGEIIITRSRAEGELRELKNDLLELTNSVLRLRQHLRTVEIEAESRIQAQLESMQDLHGSFDPLEFDRFTRLQETTRSLAEGVNDVATIQQAMLSHLDSINFALLMQSRMARDVQQTLFSIRTVPFASVSERLFRIMRSLTKELNKQANLEVIGGHYEIDRAILERLIVPLEHLLRNSLDHGVESPQDRRRQGKSERAEITIDVSHASGEIVVAFKDDGRGINRKKLREKVRERGEDPAHYNDAALINFIFDPGVSTAKTVTAISGRGIGLDIVKNEILSLGGRIEVESVEGKGTTFMIYLPLTVSIIQAILVRGTQGRTWAISASIVEEVDHVSEEVLARMYETGRADLRGKTYPFYYFDRLVDNHGKPIEPKRYNSVAFLRSGNEVVAVHVDQVIGNQEIVIKSAGTQLLRRINGLAGATILGTGEIVLIVNPIHLAQRYYVDEAPHAENQVTALLPPPKLGDVTEASVEAKVETKVEEAKVETKAEETKAEEAKVEEAKVEEAKVEEAKVETKAVEPVKTAPPARKSRIQQIRAKEKETRDRIVLVVDDSLTVRKVTSRLLSREGFHVETAKDGFDALKAVNDRKPDIILLDIEMPKMDGFEFAKLVKADEALRDIPIIMITSRTADKHRQRARELGVNDYLGKPYQEDELLNHIRDLLSHPKKVIM